MYQSRDPTRLGSFLPSPHLAFNARPVVGFHRPQHERCHLWEYGTPKSGGIGVNNGTVRTVTLDTRQTMAYGATDMAPPELFLLHARQASTAASDSRELQQQYAKLAAGEAKSCQDVGYLR